MLKDNEKIKIDRLVSNYEKPIYGIWIEDKKRFDNFDKNELNYLIKDHITDVYDILKVPQILIENSSRRNI